jgi:hypothetical protein
VGPAREEVSVFDDPGVVRLDCAGRSLLLDRPRIMGVVNVTPDSFSDGGQHADVEAAVAHALRLADEGADLLDVGGESTRPGAAEVSVEQELGRVLPVIEQLVARDRDPGFGRHLKARGDARRGRGRGRNDQRCASRCSREGALEGRRRARRASGAWCTCWASRSLDAGRRRTTMMS